MCTHQHLHGEQGTEGLHVWKIDWTVIYREKQSSEQTNPLWACSIKWA